MSDATWRTRRAAEADLAQLAAIEAASRGRGGGVEALVNELGLSWATILVGEVWEDGAWVIVGFVDVWRVADEVEILFVATDPLRRRAGHGRRCLLALFAHARETGATKVLLEVRPSNTAAVALYKHLGFAEVGRRPRYYDDNEDALLMNRDLTDESSGDED